MKLGIHTIPTILGICTLGSSFVAPTLWATNIKENVAVQQNTIGSIRETQSRFNETLSGYDIRIQSIERKLDILLYKNGIDPNTILGKK